MLPRTARRCEVLKEGGARSLYETGESVKKAGKDNRDFLFIRKRRLIQIVRMRKTKAEHAA